MPKQTYNNLDKDKKERLIEACLEEFSHYTFSDSSINRIIKNCDISRGSFYQYFENKEDCYMEILGIIAQEKYEIIQVKTVDEGRYKEYDQTIAFYKKMGFLKLEVFPTLWDEWNPCLIMIKKLDAK